MKNGHILLSTAAMAAILSGSGGPAAARRSALESLLAQPGSQTYAISVPPVSSPAEQEVKRDLAEDFYVRPRSAQVIFTVPAAGSLAYYTINLAQAFENGKNDIAFIKLVPEKYAEYLENPSFKPLTDLAKLSVGDPISLCSINAKNLPITNALDLLVFTSLYSANLAEFKQNAQPLFAALPDGANLQTEVFGILSDWSADHETFYSPAKNAKTQLAAAFKGRAAALKVEAVTQKIDLFTGKLWPAEVPFTVALTPVPQKSTSGVGGRTYATAIHIPVHLGHMAEGWDKYIDPKVGVVVHEVFHSMLGQYLNSGSQTLHRGIKDYYTSHPLPPPTGGGGGLEGQIFNDLSEVLATAVGQGYVGNGGDKTKVWHGYTGVDAAAKEIYRFYMDYLYFGKQIDAEFLKVFLDLRFKYRGNNYSW